ncbi:ArsR/SmtB family transcription factor [Desulfofalx alkaliphila]|uniref:ArsR/SmtB family transcription factor n=1 Tax=Desulfofalx alkaliphila TaxID=105483 RepID=UPI0004E1FEC8|nr:metalloregulator ArsR/SmtB family transcription factor [Desulfofalx alkaliphila]
MSEKIAQMKADLLKALAHPTRVRILELLKHGELCVCDIFEKLEVEQANASQHLAILKKQDILKRRKEGLRVYYCIKHNEVIDILNIADKILVMQAEERAHTINKYKKSR